MRAVTAMSLLPKPHAKPVPRRTREQVLAELRKDRDVLVLLPVNDPRRPLMRQRIDVLLDELLNLAREPKEARHE